MELTSFLGNYYPAYVTHARSGVKRSGVSVHSARCDKNTDYSKNAAVKLYCSIFGIISVLVMKIGN